MNDGRQDARAGKTHQSGKTDGEALNAKDLTCQEAQLEELLSKGESTEGEADEAQDENPADRNAPQ
jgi:hypothetical protein